MRTQIQLTESQIRRLRIEARERGISLAAVVRRHLDRGLADEQSDLAERYRRAAMLIGAFPGPGDLSEKHDQYLAEAFEADLATPHPAPNAGRSLGVKRRDVATKRRRAAR